MFSGRALKYFGALTTLSSLLVYHYRPFTSTILFESAETKLLSKYIKTPFKVEHIPISNDNYLNTLTVFTDESKPNLVLMHGWSSGLALWAKNIDELAEKYNVYAVDLLGFGRSARPYFPRASGATPDQAKEFWIDSFHEWKMKMFNDSKIQLLGHSLVNFIHFIFPSQKIIYGTVIELGWFSVMYIRP